MNEWDISVQKTSLRTDYHKALVSLRIKEFSPNSYFGPPHPETILQNEPLFRICGSILQVCIFWSTLIYSDSIMTISSLKREGWNSLKDWK